MFVLAQSDGRGFFDGVRDGLDRAWDNIVAFAPKLAGALVILLIGWILARIIRTVLTRGLKRLGFDKLLERAGLADTLKNAGFSASQVVANILYWIALMIVFLVASEALQVDRLTDLISDLVSYLPLVAVAIVILVVTAAIGAFLGDLVRPWAEREQVAWLAPAVRFSVIGFGIIAALNTLNVAEDIVNTLFIAVVATIGVSIAVAAGIGGIDRAKAFWWKIFPEK